MSPPSTLSLHFLKSLSFLQPSKNFSKTRALKPLLNRSLTTHASSSAPNSLPPSDQQIPRSISNLDGTNPRESVPVVRTYENDLARLSFIGDVTFLQALLPPTAIFLPICPPWLSRPSFQDRWMTAVRCPLDWRRHRRGAVDGGEEELLSAEPPVGVQTDGAGKDGWKRGSSLSGGYLTWIWVTIRKKLL